MIVELTEKGRALRDKARDIPKCVLAASGQTLEYLQKLQNDPQELRSHLQDSLWSPNPKNPSGSERAPTVPTVTPETVFLADTKSPTQWSGFFIPEAVLI